MINARRNYKITKPPTHAGLVYSRRLEFAADKDPKANNAKITLLQDTLDALNHRKSQTFYRGAFQRWKSSIPALNTIQWDAQTQTRMIIGLGGENVTETGLTLHHTYGMPYIPGSALKGLAAHYAHQILGEVDPKWKIDGEYHACLFGNQAAGGLIQFFDGWLDPDACQDALLIDVMTPHHTGYYMERNEQELEPPSDFDKPIPVPFLSIQGKFHLVLSTWATNIDSSYLLHTHKIVMEALKNWGIGGKTSSGYGRLIST